MAFFIRMGVWQWTKGESSHGTLQNLFYGVEWWVFTAFVLYLWVKMIKEEVRPSPTPPNTDAATEGGGPEAVTTPATADGESNATAPAAVAAGPLPASPPDSEDPDDAELAAYNAYLASLYQRDRT